MASLAVVTSQSEAARVTTRSTWRVFIFAVWAAFAGASIVRPH
jgi:hypothetical protein